jgi:UDP-N-acetylmuramoyl-tripeptide--D-alanyl-D-alanine ligase
MATPIPTNRALFELPDVALATNGTIRARGPRNAAPAVGVFSDSRAVRPNSIFVALRGEAHDGHSFLAKAVENGASIVVVEKGRHRDVPSTVAVVEVDDTLVAWGGLAGAHLTRWRAQSMVGRVIAITGSAGKTTTKELTALLLAQIGPTHFTAGNLNNRIGVPAVIFALEPQHRYCVLEMGMSLPGELDAICGFAKPDVSVVVNVGVAHAEGVGGREGVMHEKGAVYRALDKSGIAIVNADDAMARRAARQAHVRKVETFGRGAGAERPKGSFAHDFAHEPSFAPMSVPQMTASRPITLPPMSAPPAEILATAPPHYQLVDRVPEGAGSRVVIACAGRELTVHLPIPGEAAAIDLTAALAAQEAASRELLTADQIETALAQVSLTGRGTVRTLERDVLLIDDTYNANPASMRAALATLHEIAPNRRKVAILGEMKELGHLAEPEHEALGDDIVNAGVALAIGCGGLIDLALEAAKAKAEGLEVVLTSSAEEAAQEALARIQPGDAVLVKASRSVGAERVVAALGP